MGVLAGMSGRQRMLLSVAAGCWLACVAAWVLSAAARGPVSGVLDMVMALGFAGMLWACLAVHPRTRHHAWRFVVAGAWPLACPLLLEPLGRLVNAVYPMVAGAGARGMPRMLIVTAPVIVTGSLGMLGAISGVVIGVLTRSWRVGLVIVVATLPVLIWLERFDVATSVMVGAMWWTVTAAALLVWVVSGARRFGPGRCGACGYDVRGIEGSVCPECGGAISSPASAGSASGAGPGSAPPSPS